MAHHFCCCCFDILNRGRQDYCSFSNIKYETFRFLCWKSLSWDPRLGRDHLVESVPPQAARHCRHLVWRLCGSYNQSIHPHHDTQNTSRDLSWNLQPTGRDESHRHKAYKKTRETANLVRVLLQHGILYTKRRTSIANLHHPWRKERKKLGRAYVKNHSRSFAYQPHSSGLLNQCTLHYPWS